MTLRLFTEEIYLMNCTTTELLNRLKQAEDINGFIEENSGEFMETSFVDFLNEMLVCKNTSVADVMKGSGQSDYVYKIFRGERKPSRDIVIAVAVGMGLDADEAQLLLRIAKLARLDPRDKRDSVIIYGLKEKLDIGRINDILYDLNEATL